MTNSTFNIFKAYDIRGIYPNEINEEIVYQIAHAYAHHFKVKSVVVGCDVRTSSPDLKAALIKGLTQHGVAVYDIGTVSTDMMYFATAFLKTDGGITVSASHNPREYNGLKMVLADAVPISSDSGLFTLRDMILSNADYFVVAPNIGLYEVRDIYSEYIEHIRSFIDISKLKPLTIVANGNFGMAGTVVQTLLEKIPTKLILLNEKPDGSFPKGRPDPMIPENRMETQELVLQNGADLGVAWDADADRCFFYDEKGEFIHGYYITALLAQILLRKNPGEKIIFDPRLTRATTDFVLSSGGIPVINKSGHTFIKERMRKENALFAGEVSAHYYFRDNFYADNGMIPFLLILEELSISGKKLSELVQILRTTYPVMDETNFKVKNVAETIQNLKLHYSGSTATFIEIDGVSVEFPEWRFNVRGSNTEPLLRLNIEASNSELLKEKFNEVTEIIKKNS